MQRFLVASVLAALSLTSALPTTSAATLGACSTDQVDNTWPASYYALGKPATMFSDDCYHQFLVNEPDTATVDVLILPVAGPVGLRDTGLLRQSVNMWAEGIHDGALATGRPWLANGLQIRAYAVGIDVVPEAALQDPEVIIVSADTVTDGVTGYAGVGMDAPLAFCGPVNVNGPFPTSGQIAAVPGFDAHHGNGWGTLALNCGNTYGRHCFVAQASLQWLPSDDTARTLFDLNSHEFGHCLGLGHVGDASDFAAKVYPRDDIMSYENDPWHPNYTLCVSNLNIKTLAYIYGPWLGRAPGTDGQLLGGYMTMENGASAWRAVNAAGGLTSSPSQCAQPTVTLVPQPDLPEVGVPTKNDLVGLVPTVPELKQLAVGLVSEIKQLVF